MRRPLRHPLADLNDPPQPLQQVHRLVRRQPVLVEQRSFRNVARAGRVRIAATHRAVHWTALGRHPGLGPWHA